MSAGPAWSPADDAELERLWRIEGLSASKCAIHFEGRSRNAVIGRVNRLRLCRPMGTPPRVFKAYPLRDAPKGSRKGTQMPRAVRWADEPPVPSKPLPVASGDVLSPNKAHWLDREPRQCAYFVDGTSGADAIACCNPTDGKTYCPGHKALTIREDQPKPLTGRDAGVAGNDFRRTPRPKDDGRFSSWLAA